MTTAVLGYAQNCGCLFEEKSYLTHGRFFLYCGRLFATHGN